jgi:hypothetical protein
LGFLRDRKLLREGLPARARVISAHSRNDEPGSAVVPMRLRVAVSGEGIDEFEIEMDATVDRARIVAAGTVLAVRIDRDDPRLLAVDWEASERILREGDAIAGLEGTEFGRALGDVLASGREVTPEQIAAMNEAARRK